MLTVSKTQNLNRHNKITARNLTYFIFKQLFIVVLHLVSQINLKLYQIKQNVEIIFIRSWILQSQK